MAPGVIPLAWGKALVLLSSDIESCWLATSKLLMKLYFSLPPPSLFFFFSQPLSGRGNDFVHPLTYYIPDAPSTQYSNEVPKLSKETGSVHKVHNTPMMSPPKKCLPKSAFTAQLEGSIT